MSSIPKIIELTKIQDLRGNLSSIEGADDVPFEIARTYWIYDVPGGETRGSHAFRNNQEFIVALSGSFDVDLNCNGTEFKFTLNRSYYGLFVPEFTWRTLSNFSTNSLALVLASTVYEESDYIRDFNEFLKEIE